MVLVESSKEELLDPAQEYEIELLRRNEVMHTATKLGDSDVQQFYDGSTVFLTGGSGFLGKQLIEKLLRATNVSKILVLLRPKKGILIEQRLKELLESPVYDLLKEIQPGFEQKILALEGNVSELRLGLSDEDWKMVTTQTDIIFHMAATTRFDEALRLATLSNLRGTREALQLAKECTKLRSFVYVSTAYSQAKFNLIKSKVLEDFYPSPIAPEAMIRMVETMEEEKLNDITKSLIKGWPNTYSFLKAVTEEIVRQASEELPICVVRPGIVSAALREPKPGWVDPSNLYGSTGMALALGIGLMHVLYGNRDTKLGMIPVDYVNNATIVAGYQTAKSRLEGDTKAKVYTVLCSTRTKLTWGLLMKEIGCMPLVCSSPSIIYYSTWITTQNVVLFKIFTWFFHIIPAYIIDGVCWILGQQRRFVNIYNKIYKLSIALAYYSINDWEFQDNNLATLYKTLSTVDKEIFFFDIDKMNLDEYVLTYGMGIRKYILKDGLKGSYYGRKKRMLLKCLHYTITPLYLFIWYKIFCYFILILSWFIKLFM